MQVSRARFERTFVHRYKRQIHDNGVVSVLLKSSSIILRCFQVLQITLRSPFLTYQQTNITVSMVANHRKERFPKKHIDDSCLVVPTLHAKFERVKIPLAASFLSVLFWQILLRLSGPAYEKIAIRHLAPLSFMCSLCAAWKRAWIYFTCMHCWTAAKNSNGKA